MNCICWFCDTAIHNSEYLIIRNDPLKKVMDELSKFVYDFKELTPSKVWENTLTNKYPDKYIVEEDGKWKILPQ